MSKIDRLQEIQLEHYLPAAAIQHPKEELHQNRNHYLVILRYDDGEDIDRTSAVSLLLDRTIIGVEVR